MRKMITLPKREQERGVNITVYKGLSGLDIEVNVAHRDVGRRATITTGTRVEVLGSVPRHLYNTRAVRLPNGKVTTVAPEELQYEKN